MTALDVSFDRVFEVLDLKPMITDKPDAVAIPRGPASVEFDHVDFTYPSADEVSLASLESVAVLATPPTQPVLFDVSFLARAGDLVALVGPSGAGKTTISHLIPRLYDVACGALSGSAGSTCVTRRLDSVRTTWSGWSRRTRTCSTTRSAPISCSRKPGANDAELIGGPAGGPRSCR